MNTLVGPWLDALGFVAKVVGLSLGIAIVLKTLAPRLPLPATTAVSLAIVLTPALVMAALLCWQLWVTDHAHSTHPRRNQS